MIKPMEKAPGKLCEKHPREVLHLLCEKCLVLICVLCSYGEHKGHPTSLAEAKFAQALADIKGSDRKLEKKKKESLTDVEKGKADRHKIQQDFDDAMHALKRKYDSDMTRVEQAIAEGEETVTQVEALQKDVRTTDASSSLEALVSLQQKITAVLGLTLMKVVNIDGMRKTLKSLVPDNPRCCDSQIPDTDDVALPIKFYHGLRDFVNGLTNNLPNPPQWPARPVPLRWRDDAKTDLAFVEPAAAKTILQATEGVPQLMKGKHVHPNGEYSLLQDVGGKPLYTSCWINEGNDRKKHLGAWMVPVDSELQQAARQATGHSPRRLTGYGGKPEYPLTVTCGEWRRKWMKNGLHVHY